MPGARPPSTRYFYPRSPRGERPAGCTGGPGRGRISIHAPREGSDVSSPVSALSLPRVFLSTLPARGATTQGRFVLSGGVFLSTLPARGATVDELKELGKFDISIHAPREGSDEIGPYSAYAIAVFLSTLPARGATMQTVSQWATTSYFYPRSPRGERPPRPAG